MTTIDFSNQRLSIPFVLRMPLAMTVGSFSGFALGAAHGGQEASLRFRAENAHRLPSNQAGWYLYHKSKNYNRALGAVKEGLRMALRQAVWVGVFFGMEEGVDRFRAGVVRRWRNSRGSEKDVVGSNDFFSSLLAGLGTAGAFSTWNRLPVPTAARVAKLGAKAGLVFGLVQDVLRVAQGRRVGYVEFVSKHLFGKRDVSPASSSLNTD
ncbi:hypothetical protein K431DRAFT_225412 [Polychaeton citri CBS 116435]|uniref:Uncharacterized protein n=1 Tax=Polychaeton citri CBS 116435 TaxID=1314669 RepID=A0A9P4UM77_9PEZI|nr:hypothetical protein K431DRAFT_225412 [Polychaeton citri CBS 116435]